MRGKAPASPLTVNERLSHIIERLSNKTTISSRLKKRVIIIRDGINGKSKYSTTKELKIDWYTVCKWRARWEESISMLIEASEQGISGKTLADYELINIIKDILSDKPRTGKPKRITLAQEEQIRALACTKPTEHGIQVNNWTHEMLTLVVKAKGIVDKISVRSVGNILKKTK